MSATPRIASSAQCAPSHASQPIARIAERSDSVAELATTSTRSLTGVDVVASPVFHDGTDNGRPPPAGAFATGGVAGSTSSLASGNASISAGKSTSATMPSDRVKCRVAADARRSANAESWMIASRIVARSTRSSANCSADGTLPMIS